MARQATYGERVSNIARQALVDRLYAEAPEGERQRIEDYVSRTIGNGPVESLAAAADDVERTIAYERARAVKSHFAVRITESGAVVKLRDAKDKAFSAQDAHALSTLENEMRAADATRFDTIAERVAKAKASRAARDVEKPAERKPSKAAVTVPNVDIPH